MGAVTTWPSALCGACAASPSLIPLLRVEAEQQGSGYLWSTGRPHKEPQTLSLSVGRTWVCSRRSHCMREEACAEPQAQEANIGGCPRCWRATQAGSVPQIHVTLATGLSLSCGSE